MLLQEWKYQKKFCPKHESMKKIVPFFLLEQVQFIEFCWHLEGMFSTFSTTSPLLHHGRLLLHHGWIGRLLLLLLQVSFLLLQVKVDHGSDVDFTCPQHEIFWCEPLWTIIDWAFFILGLNKSHPGPWPGTQPPKHEASGKAKCFWLKTWWFFFFIKH
jgi:hypothetical protein